MHKTPAGFTFRPLTPETAWLLGLIFGDGSLDKRGTYFRIFSGDYDVLDKCKAIIGGNPSILQSGKRCRTLSVNSKRLWAELVSEFGLMAHKSYRLPIPRVSRNLLPHFVRGLVDSDGCWCKRSGSLYFVFAITCKEFVEWMRATLIAEVGVRPGPQVLHIRLAPPHRDCYRIAYSHHDGVLIGRWIYSDPTSPRCERKYQTWLKLSSVKVATQSPRQIRELVDLYNSGKGITELARKVGVDASGLRKTLIRYGVKLRPHGDANHKLNHEQRDEVVRRYIAGESAYALGAEFGWNVSHLYRYLRKRGLVRHPCPRSAGSSGRTASVKRTFLW